jgi:two-component system, OmpR family, sensor kinase
MTRHFLQLYVLIVVTLAAVSWGQEKLWEIYSAQDDAAHAQGAALVLLSDRLHEVPPDARAQFVRELAGRTGVDVELFESKDIVGDDMLARLTRGDLAHMHAADKDWLLKRMPDDGRVLAFRYASQEAKRGVIDWVLAFVFYALIALVIMGWLWPLTRDLKYLERSTTSFGNRNWTFDTRIGMRSPVHSLAEAFRRMAARIDSLVGAQRDMTNAMSHEIKTPLARMHSEVEMARTASEPAALARHLSSIDGDIAELDAFVTATLDYAILERAEIALNIHEHDLTAILPVLVDSLRRTARQELRIRCEVSPNATKVKCDAHLFETVVRNLLYNAIRYARSEIHVVFFIRPDGVYNLRVDDDGPGIQPADRARIFDSFVQLDNRTGRKTGYGLGLAIVKRIVEWHGGVASVTRAGLGGAGLSVTWGPDIR